MSIEQQVNKAIQFELWNECNNGCIFCSNKYVYNDTVENKLHNLQLLRSKLLDNELYGQYNVVGLIGGEFFQGQLANTEVKDLFFECIRIINQKLNEGKLKQFWTCCTLTREYQPDLYQFIESIDAKSKLWICTSYDIKGRFLTAAHLKHWQDHMLKIKKLYPETNINVTTILTGSFIEQYCSGKFNLEEFKSKYSCTWFSKPPMVPSDCSLSKEKYNEEVLADFFPKRKDFLKFLLKFKNTEHEYEYDKLFNTELRADALVKPYHDNDEELMVIKRDKATNEEVTYDISSKTFVDGRNEVDAVHNETHANCKHNKAYSPYVDSDACFYCDKEMVKSL